MDSFLKTGKLGQTSSPSNSKPKASTSEKNKGPIPWVEKYRPRSIGDVVSQDEVVAVLRKTLDGADLPNLLFYGPPGTGKTSTILAVARELFGDLYKERVMELNASDERGIQVIREKVKNFAQTAVSSTRQKANGGTCPPFKIIVLDEADSLTQPAQAALRRTMEKQSATTRFCLLCNYVTRIINPLTSRCSKFRFKPLDEPALLQHLESICAREGVECENDDLKTLISTCEGDLRKAITSLQSVARLKGAQRKIDIKDILEITGVVPDEWADGFLETSKASSKHKDIMKLVDNFILEGYSATQLLYQIHDKIIQNAELSENKKIVLLRKIAECEYRLSDGADETLQLLDFAHVAMGQMAAAR